jgi:formate dehydrogenase maturation protein FdhE
MMDLFESNETGEIDLEDLPMWQDFEAVQDWREDLAEAQQEAEDAEKRLKELKGRRARQMTGDVITSTTETLRQVAEGKSLGEKIGDARQQEAQAKLKVKQVESRREEAYSEALEELLEEADEKLTEALRAYVKAVRQFGKARSQLAALDMWADQLNRKYSEAAVPSGPIQKPYDLQEIPDLSSPISAEELAQNLEQGLESDE